MRGAVKRREEARPIGRVVLRDGSNHPYGPAKSRSRRDRRPNSASMDGGESTRLCVAQTADEGVILRPPGRCGRVGAAKSPGRAVQDCAGVDRRPRCVHACGEVVSAVVPQAV